MKRRIAILTTMLALPVIAADPPEAQPAAPVDLRCDGSPGPLAAGRTPRLTWRIESAARRAATRAWQVLVASNETKLARDEGDLWNSGKVSPRREPGAIYAGKPLAAGDRCCWKVRWWDAAGRASPWSGVASWEVAPHAPAEWKGARWMNDGRENPTRDEDFYRPDPAPLMRREFTLEKPVAHARLHLAGLGLCLPSLNGERLDDHVFDPPWTAFDKRVFFRSHDVTGLLHEGRNCLGLALGNGWYNPLPLRMWGRRNLREALPVGRPRALACLVVTHRDGTTTTVTSGDGWSTAPGPTLRNSIYLGEERDARLAPAGWDLPGFDDASWKPVRSTDDALDVLQPLAMPPARLGEPVPARSVSSPSAGVHVVDFGRNLTGLPEITLKAPRGTRVVFRYGELVHEDGTLNPMTSVCGQIKGTRKTKDGDPAPVGGPGAPAVAWQQDVYIARGGGPERYRPDFTFHGFRYMEVRGLPQPPVPGDCRAFPLRTDLPPAGSFASSSERLNRIQEMCRRTFLANVVTVQSDCPHRERFAYGGDIVATSSAYLMNFDMHGFYAKTVRDWADAARPDGRLTDTAPFVGVDYCGVGWAMVHPLLLEQLYRHYGDRRLLDEQVPVAARWMEGLAGQREDDLLKSGLGDHEALVRSRGPQFSTPMFIHTARRVARLHDLIGGGGEGKRFEEWAAASSAAWEKAFLDAGTGKAGEGTQPEQCFALGFGAADEQHRDRIFARLVAELTAAEDGPGLTTGIYGTRILLEELSERGRADLAHALADRRTFPSWAWMLDNGATTLWEHWAGSDNTYSHSHPMFGSVSAWFFRWLGGIQCAGDAVGFDRIEIRPQVVGGLEWVKCSHDSVRGRIVSNWSVDGGHRDFEIVIPPDTLAVVELPRRPDDRLSEGGAPLDQRPEIRLLEGGEAFRLEIGGGHYRFRLSPGP